MDAHDQVRTLPPTKSGQQRRTNKVSIGRNFALPGNATTTNITNRHDVHNNFGQQISMHGYDLSNVKENILIKKHTHIYTYTLTSPVYRIWNTLQATVKKNKIQTGTSD